MKHIALYMLQLQLQFTLIMRYVHRDLCLCPSAWGPTRHKNMKSFKQFTILFSLHFFLLTRKKNYQKKSKKSKKIKKIRKKSKKSKKFKNQKKTKINTNLKNQKIKK